MAGNEEPPTPPSVFPGFAALSSDLADVIGHLAQRRRAQGLSQTDVAARMRTSQSAVARLEAGQGDIRVSTLQRYAQALGHDLQFGIRVGDAVEEAP